MKTLQAQVPDRLFQQVEELAATQGSTVDHVVRTALESQLSASPNREGIRSRAGRVDWKAMDEILARVPDAPPLPGDELPDGYKPPTPESLR